MMIDLRGVAEEVLLINITTKVEELLDLLRKYVAYKLFSADDAKLVKDLREETKDINELLKALTTYEESKNENKID